MARYSDIERAISLKRAYDNRETYRETYREPNVGVRPNGNPLQETVGVIPFDLNVGTDDVILVKSPQAVLGEMKGLVDQISGIKVFRDSELQAKTPAQFSGFKPARVVWNRSATRSVERKTSAVTRTPYLKYNTTRLACAFGRETAASQVRMVTAFTELKSLLQNTGTYRVNRVSLTPEKFNF